ncbi:MAG: Rho termination factor N-terminal domain-containing protein [Candidatus Odinarchaeota archaeon]
MSRKIEDKTYLNYLLQSLNIDDLKQVCRDFNIKGFSKWKKLELIENILSLLSEEEQKELIKEKELEIITNSLDLAIKKIKGIEREKISAIRIVNDEDHLVEIDFEGFNWKSSSYLAINPENIDNPERDCDCRIGANMGFCSHFWVGFILSLKRSYFQLKDWTLTILPEDFEKKIQNIEISVILSEQEEPEAEVLTLIDASSDDVEMIKHLDQSITIYEGEIVKIEKKQQQFQDIVTNYYLGSLNNVRFGPRIQKKSDFKEEEIETIDELSIRISEKLYEEIILKEGDKITTNGKLTRDDFLKLYVVKNIRKITKIKD